MGNTITNSPPQVYQNISPNTEKSINPNTNRKKVTFGLPDIE